MINVIQNQNQIIYSVSIISIQLLYKCLKVSLLKSQFIEYQAEVFGILHDLLLLRVYLDLYLYLYLYIYIDSTGNMRIYELLNSLYTASYKGTN